MLSLFNLRKELKKKSSAQKAKILQRFFKTGQGEYGEGDVFLGIVVPEIRKTAERHKDLKLQDVVDLLHSKIHEERLTALLIMVDKFQAGEKAIYDEYLANTKYINNWDLVDLTAHKIIGRYLFNREKEVLYKLAKSRNIWERRISIIATFEFIKNFKFNDSLKIAKVLLKDDHDLIQKAVGWMLREIGKRDLRTEEAFLKKHYKSMPRTMLRYAIERFPEKKRRRYLA